MSLFTLTHADVNGKNAYFISEPKISLRVIDPHDGWKDYHFLHHELPYRDDNAMETWLNGDGDIYGDIGASHD